MNEKIIHVTLDTFGLIYSLLYAHDFTIIVIGGNFRLNLDLTVDSNTKKCVYDSRKRLV